MRYSRRTSNYLERVALSNPTHMMSMADPIAIGVETLRIDSGCSLEKEFTELNPYESLNDNIPKLSIRLIHVTVVYEVL